MNRDWKRVKIHLYPAAQTEPPEEPVRVFVRTDRTAFQIRQMMQEHFPEGPLEAAKCHGEHRDWGRANAMKFFQPKDPLTTGAQRWQSFLGAWGNKVIEAQSRGIKHAHGERA